MYGGALQNLEWFPPLAMLLLGNKDRHYIYYSGKFLLQDGISTDGLQGYAIVINNSTDYKEWEITSWLHYSIPS